MEGSGLAEAISVIYGPETVKYVPNTVKYILKAQHTHEYGDIISHDSCICTPSGSWTNYIRKRIGEKGPYRTKTKLKLPLEIPR